MRMRARSTGITMAALVAATGFLAACTGPDPGGFTTVTGTVTRSPTCGGPQRPGQDCTAPVAGAVVHGTGSGPPLSATTDADGRYRLTGHDTTLTLTVETTGDAMLRCPQVTVHLSVGRPAVQDIDCDTGIR
jgi:hypothetical protein